jgi:hypothetical protein
VVISKPDSNFKHGPSTNFNGKEMKWIMMLKLLSLGLLQWKGNEVDDDVGVIEFGTKFFAGCLEIHVVAVYVECRSLKAWHNT